MTDNDGSNTGVPDSSTAQKLIKEFESVTNTNEILAQCHLQDNGWDIQRALNSYFTGASADTDMNVVDSAASATSEEETPKNIFRQVIEEGALALTTQVDSDESDHGGVPDSVTAQKLIKEFEHVTDTDEILAQIHLQEYDWDLKKALDAYFGKKCERREREKNIADAAASTMKIETPKKTVSEGLLQGVLTTQAPESLVMVSWNIDGLDQHNLKIRTKAVCKIVEQEKADIVFLQEVIPETFSYLESKLPGYECLAAHGKDYFVATLLRRGRVYLDRHTVVDFPGSRMQRHVMAVQAHCGSVNFDLFNTHLESTKEHEKERMNQLKSCLEQMDNRPGNRVVILGGDLNMRDKELEEVGGLPRGIRDVWEQCGSRKEVRYTWDMIRNSNLQSNFGKFRPRCRFDRIYLKDSLSPTVKATGFGLIGLQKITGTQSFPSDHWGLKVGLSLKQGPVTENPRKKMKTEAEIKTEEAIKTEDIKIEEEAT